MKNRKEIEVVARLFEEKYGEKPDVSLLVGGGSDRKYFRLTSVKEKVVGVYGNQKDENKLFIDLAEVLSANGILVPEIIQVSSDFQSYLIEDLGDISLFNLLKGEDRVIMAKKALDDLIQIQSISEEKWEKLVGYPPFSERLIRWDLNYFKYDFLKPTRINFDEEKLEDDFDNVTSKLRGTSIINGLMYRDFQSRNILVKNCKLYYIDFQGARKGPLVYDAVSFIWQAKAPFTFDEREELGKYYIDKLSYKLGIVKEVIAEQFSLMILLRTLQVLGAYGFRGLIEKKSHFIESIPFAIRNLQYLKEKGYLEKYPEIKRISVCLDPKDFEMEGLGEGNLTVIVYSFSYKNGYPEDKSGNGGGFMFDCRAIHNPGRYEKYKQSTGKDREVIEFLEKTGEAEDFIKNSVNIVSPSIERYMKRGFTSLQVGFGCTGGQHRSVYCAEKFSKEIKKLYPEITVRLIHREQAEESIF